MNTTTLTAEVALLWAEAIIRDEWKAAQAEYAAWRRDVGSPLVAPIIAEDMAVAWFAEVN